LQKPVSQVRILPGALTFSQLSEGFQASATIRQPGSWSVPCTHRRQALAKLSARATLGLSPWSMPKSSPKSYLLMPEWDISVPFW